MKDEDGNLVDYNSNITRKLKPKTDYRNYKRPTM